MTPTMCQPTTPVTPLPVLPRLPLLPMVTADSFAVLARHAAIAEQAEGRMLHLCAWCAPEGTSAALAGLLVSHGICGPCMTALVPNFTEAAR